MRAWHVAISEYGLHTPGYLFQVQGHSGLRAPVVPGTVVESVVPHLLRAVPLLLQRRRDASLSMVSGYIYLGGAKGRGTVSFAADVIREAEMYHDLSRIGPLPVPFHRCC